jgi:hypothetical protein
MQGVRRGMDEMRERELAIALSQHAAQRSRQPTPSRQVSASPRSPHQAEERPSSQPPAFIPLQRHRPEPSAPTKETVEHCPHRDQRVILWYSRRVLSLLPSFPRSGFSLPLVWIVSVRPAVVLFYNLALLLLRLISFSSVRRIRVIHILAASKISGLI